MSLTPMNRSDEVAEIGMWDGLMSGACAAIPSGLAVWYGSTYSPNFIKYTNHQSRTALVIMPPLFMFALSSEQKVTHKMRQMAEERDHTNRVSEWAEQQQQQQEIRRMETKRHYEKLVQTGEVGGDKNNNDEPPPPTLSEEERERQLSDLYVKSVELSGHRVIPGTALGLHHRVANFWQENPFKILTAVSVPTIGLIFRGRRGQSHLKLQSQIMHTRVFGQFAVIIMMLTLMGFKGYMDSNGKFITETDAQMQVDEMKMARKHLLYRLEQDRTNAERMQKLKARARVELGEVKAINKQQGKKKKKAKKDVGTDILIKGE